MSGSPADSSLEGRRRGVLDAVDACLRVARLAPTDAANLRRLAVLLTQLGRTQEAIAVLGESLAVEPENPRALNNLGNLLNGAGRSAEAVAMFERAIAIQPQYALAYNNLGLALLSAQRAADSLACFDRAIALEPTLAAAHTGRARALSALGRGLDSIAAFRQAAVLSSRDPQIFQQMGRVMLGLGFGENAQAAFTAALELAPGDPLAQEGLALSLMLLNRHAEAIPVLSALRRTAPWLPQVHGWLLHARLHCADWTDFESESRAVAERVRRGEPADAPLSFLCHNDSPADQQACARRFIQDRCVRAAAPAAATGTDGARSRRAAAGRLRVAYLSPDFCEHPVAHLMVGVIESHDRARFEVCGFSTGPDDGSGMRRRMAAAFDRFIDLQALGDSAAAQTLADHSIDVAVDLGGHTLWGRTAILSQRPAPLQIAFLGFPGTLGSGFIDYIVADREVLPPALAHHYDEQPLWLANCYFPGLPPERPENPPSRAQAGLPDQAFVFCCFNGHHKILPAVFDSWMRILDACSGSVLWLRDMASTARLNFAAAARARGVDASRLIYAPRTATPREHFARLSRADLFLDTYPYNAHTTASDALRAGVPVLSRRGACFASRVAGSLLQSAGLPELSVETAEEYERRAIEIASKPEQAERLRRALRQIPPTSPLLDSAGFRRQLEAAYIAIWDRHLRGERPAPLQITAV